MRTRSLLNQVLAVNAVLVAVTALISTLLDADDVRGALLVGVAVVSAVLVNTLLLKRRLVPLEALLATMERVDLSAPGQRAHAPARAPYEVERLTAGFNKMLARIEQERIEGGRAVIRAQEEERARIAQDLHDEVNQALTAILLRLQAAALDVPPGLRSELKEIQTLATQAMEELLTLARTLRPTALDDHGLVPALASQVANFGERTGIRTTFHRHGDTPELSDEEQLVLYRVAQESLSNVVQHSGASAVRVELSSVGRTTLRVRDDGCGFAPKTKSGGRLGVSGMRERALLVGGRLNVFSAPGEGTTIELTMGASSRILIADDHGIVRGGMKLLIDRQPDMEVVAEAGDGVEAFEEALRTKPDLCVLDVSMPRMTGLQAARQIRAHLPETQVLALSMHDDERYVFDALKAGASGYVLKREVDQALLNAIRAVSRGDAFLTNAVERTIVREWMSDSSSGPEEPLTPREQEVLKLISEAFTNKQIAETLHLAEKTVESHRANLLRKLGMRDRVELVRYAIRRGLTEA